MEITPEEFYEKYSDGIPADAPMTFVREPLDLEGMMYSIQLDWMVRGHNTPIKLTASRGHSAEANWKVSVRASGINSTNTQRMIDYASALVDAGIFASKLDIGELEAAHQASLSIRNKETDAKKVFNDALLAEDPNMGKSTAKMIIDGLVGQVKDDKSGTAFAVIECARRDGGYWNTDKKFILLDFYGDSNWSRKVRFRTMDLGHGGLPVVWDSSDRVARDYAVETFGEGSQTKNAVLKFTSGTELEKWWRVNKTQ
jgi:hypothetical protein